MALDHDTQRRRATGNNFSKYLCASVPQCVVLSGRRIAALVALVLLVARPVAADEIQVMTSGAFTEAYQQLVKQFQQTTHHTVVTTFGASM